jgi:branched-chain amino acid transport system permease protein
MEIYFAQLLNGLVYGMLLFLTAAGLSLIFGLMNVVSLAHGSFFMLGAYIALSVTRQTQNFWLALLIAPALTVAIGLVMERVFMRPLYRRGHLDQVLLTFGFTFVFFDAVRWIWGSDIRKLAAPEALQGSIEIAGGMFSTYRLFLLALGAGLALVLWLVMERSRLGAMVRAGVDDSAMAAGLGANIPALFTGVFGAGVALAALGGVAAGPVLGLYPGMDGDILIPSFIVIVIGGMGSLRGAFVGSLLVGVADAFGKAYVPALSMFLIYLLMAFFLLVRPQGLFGIKGGVAPAGMVVATGAAFNRPQLARWLSLAALVVLAVFPFFVADYHRTLVSEIFVFAIFAMSLDLILGYTGLPSFGHAGFFGLGAYVVIVLGSLFGLNGWLGLLVAIPITALAAVIIGFFCVRTSGITFLMLTLAFSQLLYSIAFKWRDVTGGSDGIGIAGRPTLFGWSLDDPLALYYMTFFFFVVCYLGLRRLIASPLGHSFVGVRENESRMRAIGYATGEYKLLAFTIGGTLAGFSGGLYALFNGFVSPEALHWSASGDVLIMAMLGGAGTLVGPVIGAAVFLLMKNLVSSWNDHWMMIIGVVFIACVMFFPGGIWGMLRDRVARART